MVETSISSQHEVADHAAGSLKFSLMDEREQHVAPYTAASGFHFLPLRSDHPYSPFDLGQVPALKDETDLLAVHSLFVWWKSIFSQRRITVQ